MHYSISDNAKFHGTKIMFGPNSSKNGSKEPVHCSAPMLAYCRAANTQEERAILMIFSPSIIYHNSATSELVTKTMFFSTLVSYLAMSTSTTPTVEIAPGVFMPALSLGTCCGSDPGVGLQPWIAAGGRGIDTGKHGTVV